MLPIRNAFPFALAALVLSSAAAQAAPDDAKARYERDRQACLSGNTQQARDVCLQEAGAAMEASRASQLPSAGPATQADNATERCEVFVKADEHAACLIRVQGQGNTSGSVMQGGVLRESVTTTITTLPATAAPSR